MGKVYPILTLISCILLVTGFIIILTPDIEATEFKKIQLQIRNIDGTPVQKGECIINTDDGSEKKQINRRGIIQHNVDIQNIKISLSCHDHYGNAAAYLESALQSKGLTIINVRLH